MPMAESVPWSGGSGLISASAYSSIPNSILTHLSLSSAGLKPSVTVSSCREVDAIHGAPPTTATSSEPRPVEGYSLGNPVRGCQPVAAG